VQHQCWHQNYGTRSGKPSAHLLGPETTTVRRTLSLAKRACRPAAPGSGRKGISAPLGIGRAQGFLWPYGAWREPKGHGVPSVPGLGSKGMSAVWVLWCLGWAQSTGFRLYHGVGPGPFRRALVLGVRSAMVAGLAYATLSLPRGATPADIRSAYRRCAFISHPDRPTGDTKQFL